MKLLTRHPRRTTTLIGLLLFGLVAASCGEDEPTSITIASSTPIESPQVVVALQNGFFEDNGLNVEITRFTSGRDALTALLGGQADYAIMAELPASSAAMAGESYRILAEISSLSGHQKVMTRTDTGITGFADLAGRDVGLLVGTSSHYELQLAMESVGMSSADVNVVGLGPPAQPGALETGDVDAIMAFDSFYTATKNLLGDRYAEVPGTGYHLRFLLSAGESMLDNDDVSEKVLQALLDAEELIVSDPAKAKADIVEWSGGQVNAARADEVFNTYVFGLNLGSGLVAQMVDEGEWLRDAHGVDGDPNAALFTSYINSGPLSAVASDRVNL